MSMADSPPPAYASLEDALPPVYTLGDSPDGAFHAFVLSRNPSQSLSRTILSPTETEKTTGIEDMPTEILHSIIRLACSFPCDDPDLLELRACQATIFSCAGVSRKWMAVTTSHRESWSRVLDFTVYPISTLQHLLWISRPCLFNVGHRSAPVTLSWREETSRNIYRVIQLIYQGRRCIRELHVEVGFGGSDFLLWHLCGPEMRHLKSVTWHGKPLDDTDAPPRGRIYPLPELPFTRLDFRHVLVDLYPSPHLHSLTALSIYNSPSMTLLHWIDVLRSATRLRFLSIHSSIRFDGPIPAIPSDSIQLANLVLLTIESHTHAEAVHHLTLLAAINIPPQCGLQIAAIPHVRNAQLRVILTRKISKMMAPFTEPDLALELFADEKLRVTMGNVRDPHDRLDWTRLGEQRVLDYLQSLPVPALTITTHALSMSGHFKAFPQVVSYFGNAFYDRVASFRMSLSPPEDSHLFEEWSEHPQYDDFLTTIFNLFKRLNRVTSLSVNDGGALAVCGSLGVGQEEAEKRKQTDLGTAQDNPTFVPDFPILQVIILHASKSIVGTVCTGEFLSERASSGYPLNAAILPALIADPEPDLDEEFIESILSKPIVVRQFIAYIQYTPLAQSAYFYKFCRRS